MAAPIDITGRRFGQLTAVEVVGTKGGTRQWLCRCMCSGEVVRLRTSLMTGATTSCGCARRLSVWAPETIRANPGLRFPCPRCGVGAGSACEDGEGNELVSVSTDRRKVPSLHASRRDVAAAAGETSADNRPGSPLGRLTPQAPVTTRHVSELDAKTARKYTVDPATLARVVAGENGDEDLTRNERRRQEVGMKRAAEALGRWHLVKAPSTLRCDRCQRELKKRASRAVRRALPSTTLCFACAEADPAIEISVACGPTGPPQTTLTEGGR